MTRTEHARAPLCLVLAAGWAAFVLVPSPAAAETTRDAGETDADGTRGQDTGMASAEARKSSKAETPATDRTVLVEEGEPIADIDKIIETLDRRAPVRAVAFSPDGSLIVSGSEDHTVRLWHLATGRLIRRLAGHSSDVTAVAFSPDGLVLASASNDRTVRLWDARSGRLLRVLQGHVYHVYAVAFDPQGRWVATASWDRTIQLWDLKTGALLRKLRGHEAAVRSIDFSHDGQWLASGSDDQTVRLWDMNTGRELRVLKGHTGSVSAVRFRPDGQWLVSGSADRTARVWQVGDGKMLRKLADCGGPVLGLADSPNGQILAGACGSGGSVLWDVPTGAPLRQRAGQGSETRAIAFSPDGRMVASGSEDATIVVEDVATGRVLTTLSANVAHLEALAFSPDGHTLATASRDRRVLVWQDSGEHKILGRVLVGAEGVLRALAFSPDGKVIAAAGEERKLVFWEQKADKPSSKRSRHQAAINALAFTPDGRNLVSAGDDASVRVWDLKTNAEIAVLQGHRAPVRALAFSPDGKVLASASDDQSVRLWDVSSGRGLGVLKSHRAPVTSVAFSSDGKFLLTGSLDRTIDVWLFAKNKHLKPLRKELTSGVVALAAHGNGVVSASADGMLTFWELGGSRPLQQVSVHADVSALSIAPDGVTIASASRDGVLRLWDSKTLERRWSLAGSTRERWFACNDTQMCWRHEDGALLGRVDGQGDFVPVSPSDSAHRTTLAVGVEGKDLKVVEGKTVAIPLWIENRGAHPAYWVSVAQSVRSSGTASLVLIPPPTTTVLAPGARMKAVCEVSALGEYENPVPHSETVQLSITSASAQPLSLEIPIRVETPHITLRALALSSGAGEVVTASLGEVSMAQLKPVILQGALDLEGGYQVSVTPITLEQAFNGQNLTLAFLLPEGVHLDRKARATLSVRKATHPAHVWTFAHAPVRIPIPAWFWALLTACVLGVVLVVRRTGLHAWARVLGRNGRRLARLAVAFLFGLAKAFMALVFLRSTLRSLRDHVQRGIVAIIFFRLQPETQCSHLARQLGARWRALAGGRNPVFELRFGPEVPLDLGGCLLSLALASDALTDALTQLETVEEGQDAIAVVLSDTPRAALAERMRAPRRLVVFSKAAMNRVLRAKRPALVFAQVVSAQLDRRPLSLYRSAVARGPRQPFRGRRSELRRLAVHRRGNHLIIGPQGIGKTSLLDEVHRRYSSHPKVECHFISLADGDLIGALADDLDLPDPPSLAALLQQLCSMPEGRKVVVLCDDADAWAARDAAQGGKELAALAALDRENRCSFVLAGFLGLLHAAWPAPGRNPFGDVIRLECLDDEACAELASEPMAALNAHYAHARLIEHITQESAGMPSLLVAICDQIVEGLDPNQRTIDRALVERACQSEAVARFITAWRPRFGLQDPQLAALDQTVMLSAVFKTRFTLAELQSTLASLGVPATPTEIEHSARRLVAACVFEPWLGHFHFRVPLFQEVMQEAALARVIAP